MELKYISYIIFSMYIYSLFYVLYIYKKYILLIFLLKQKIHHYNISYDWE